MMARMLLGLLLVVPLSSAVELYSGLRGHMQAQSTAAANATELKALGDSCRCEFSGLCSCVQAKEFMKCIANACDSGACDCKKHHFLYACRTMSSECPSAGMKCGVKEATCDEVPPMVTDSTMDHVGDIEALQEQRCKYEKAVKKGWINGRVRIAELEPKIQDKIEALERRGVRVPTLGCSKEDAEGLANFKANLEDQKKREEAEEVKRQAAVALKEQKSSKAKKGAKKEKKKKEEEEKEEEREEESVDKSKDLDEDLSKPGPEDEVAEAAAGTQKELAGATPKEAPGFVHSWWKLSWLHYLLVVIVHLAIAAVCALLYDKHRYKALGFSPTPVVVNPRSEDDFGVGLFSCFSDIKLCLFAFCCPCLRWADTLDRAGLLKYWPAFAAFAVLSILSPYTFGITFLLLVFVCVRYRRQMRRRYNVAPNNCEDFLAYFFCSTCAIVQEAKVEAFRDK